MLLLWTMTITLIAWNLERFRKFRCEFFLKGDRRATLEMGCNYNSMNMIAAFYCYLIIVVVIVATARSHIPGQLHRQ